MLSSAQVDDVLHQVFDPPLVADGFVRVGRRRWVRSAHIPIRDLFVVNALKGAAVAPVWGVSLDFVPHVSGRAVRWHKTAKSAQFDLRYDPIDYAQSSDWTISAFASADEAARQAAMVAGKATPSARAFWRDLKGVGDLPRAFEEKKARHFVRFGFWNYVQEPLAEAFVAAALGDNGVARQLLETYVARFDTPPEVSAALVQRLEELIATTPSRPT